MSSKEEQITRLLADIRSCRDCIVSSRHTPVVYSSKTPEVLILSQVPPENAWAGDLGDKWMASLEISTSRGGTASNLCEWLGLGSTEADNVIFWIQRVNCRMDYGWDYAFQHCSRKFIQRAIQVVKPKAIITLGRSGADWFLQFKSLADVVGRKFDYHVDDETYSVVPFFHPSNANRAALKEYQSNQDEAIRIAKALIGKR